MATKIPQDQFAEEIGDIADFVDVNFEEMCELMETGSLTITTEKGKRVLTLTVEEASE